MSQNVTRPCGLLTLGRKSNLVFGTAVALLCAGVSFAAGNLSGTYADKGVVVESASAKTTDAISFHGLLGQEFDPQLAALDFDETSHVTLDEENGVLTVEIFNREDERIWRIRWGARRGFSMEDGKAVVRMRMHDTKDERCVLVMEPTDDDRGLLVTVYHVKPGTFGPYSEPIGSYMFVRTS